ncbi:porin [Chitinimonas sp. BJYL2]|uniref:porin n=1 Tax=Chitinimonas sp. BJYL2 TaxID=2976696 RepID=UPI0022B2FC23|nr:porin [Chitinimonas sp. BJYL2]
MRKTLLAALLTGAAAVPAMAEGTVTLYGQLNIPLEFVTTSSGHQIVIGNVDNSSKAPGGVNSPSRIGFKGDENLGDGMKAWWQVETAIGPDDASSSNFANREGWVGLQGGFGKFGLGRGKTPFTNVADLFDSSVDAGSNLATYKHAMLGNTVSNRFDNAVRYDSPTMDGVTFAAMYGAGENKTSTVNAGQHWATSVRYASGPLTLAGAYSNQRNTGAVAVNGARLESLLLGGTYQIDAVKLGLGYQMAEVRNGIAAQDKKGNSVVTTIAYAMGSTTLKAGAIFNGKAKVGGVTAAGSDYIRYNLGLKHAMSKRTALYTEYTADSYDKGLDNKNKTDVNVFSVGIFHTF